MGFLFGLAGGVLLYSTVPSRCEGSCDLSERVALASPVGLVMGVIAALSMAALGAAIGHEERFVVSPP